MSVSETRLRTIKAEETYELRQSILRPNQPLDRCKYPLDQASESYHVGCFQDQRLLGVGSILPDARESTDLEHSWRIRGMAVLEEARGKGVGSQILQALIAHGSKQSGEIWCNGRVNAKSFYERQGFVQHEPIFEVPDMGPHILFIKTLQVD